MTRNYLDILAETIIENWDEPALTDFYLTEDGTAQDTTRGNSYTYGEMYGEMMRLGDVFSALGLQKGDHIAICGSNSANWTVAYLAIAAFHGVAVTVLYSQNIEDIAGQIDFSDSVALFTDNDLWDELQSHNLEQVKHVISLADWSILHGELTRENCERTTREEELRKQLTNSKLSVGIAPDDLAMICFTSGSSGVTKGVMLSYRNINASLLTLNQIFPSCIENKNILSFFPMAHMYGLLGDVLSQLIQGSAIFISKEVKIQFCEEINVVKPFQILLVPSLLNVLLTGFIKQETIHSLQYGLVGGAVVDIEKVVFLRKQGFKLTTGYGLTEVTSLVSTIQPRYFRESSCGKIISTLEIRFAPEGEILVKGENVMLGYYKNPEATAEKIDSDGWLHTGDAGYMDEDGYLYVIGRIGQDLIVLPNGENIHPEDIENKINALPEVEESIVVARDGKLVAMVLLEQGTKSKEQRQKVLDAINPQLPLYSQLNSIEFLSEPLERTAKHTIKRYLYK